MEQPYPAEVRLTPPKRHAPPWLVMVAAVVMIVAVFAFVPKGPAQSASATHPKAHPSPIHKPAKPGITLTVGKAAYACTLNKLGG